MAVDPNPMSPAYVEAISTSVKALIKGMKYEPPTKPHNYALLDALIAEADASGIDYKGDAYAVRTLRVAFGVADLTHPHHPFEIQLHIAMYTWLQFLIDDTTEKMLGDIELFQQRFYAGESQSTQLLRVYEQKLRKFYEYYDPIVAGFIILSSLEFVNCCILETRKEYKRMPESQGGERWAYYFRDMEGISDAYAYLNFPKCLCPDVSEFLQSIPDFGIFINLVNDILSFYKEERNGDVNNFVHKRARYENKPVLQVLQEIVQEAVDAHTRASLVLKDKGPYERAWHGYANGYIAMHQSQTRYRLVEIGLDRESMDGLLKGPRKQKQEPSAGLQTTTRKPRTLYRQGLAWFSVGVIGMAVSALLLLNPLHVHKSLWSIA